MPTDPNDKAWKDRVYAAGVVELILANLSDRGGFGGWWNGIDPMTKAEIRESLRNIVQAVYEAKER